MQIPCPTCRRELEHKQSRKDKPYFICQHCGVQIFFRLPEGIERLENGLANTLTGDDFVMCRRCQVAVRRSREKVVKPMFDEPGIYCPQCNKRLLRPEDCPD